MIPSTDVIQLTLTPKMTTAQVVETSVTVNNNSPIQDYFHPDDQTQPFEIGFKLAYLPMNFINRSLFVSLQGSAILQIQLIGSKCGLCLFVYFFSILPASPGRNRI